MPVENYLELLPIILLGIFFFAVSIMAFHWSARCGQLRDFEAQSKDIFTEEEPEEEVSDRFPD